MSNYVTICRNPPLLYTCDVIYGWSFRLLEHESFYCLLTLQLGILAHVCMYVQRYLVTKHVIYTHPPAIVGTRSCQSVGHVTYSYTPRYVPHKYIFVYVHAKSNDTRRKYLKINQVTQVKDTNTNKYEYNTYTLTLCNI